MACATLKRNHNFDILDSNCAKRRRLQTSCASEDIPIPQSVFISKAQITQAQLKVRIKEEIKRLQRRRLIPRFLGGPAPIVSTTFKSHVQEENSVVTSCNGGFRSMALRSPQHENHDSDTDQSVLRVNELNTSFDCTSTTPSSSQSTSSQPVRSLDSVPIFTLSQVTTLCERLIKEREEDLRQEYDTILCCKLAEQYEAFLKFDHDQLYSRFKSTPMSYVS